MKSDMIIFNSKLYEIRKGMKLTQKELAEKSGVDVQIISRIECHSGNPNLVSAAMLAKYLGVSIDELFNEFDELEKIM